MIENGESDDLSNEMDDYVGNEYDFAEDTKNNSFSEDEEGGLDEFGHIRDAQGRLYRRATVD